MTQIQPTRSKKSFCQHSWDLKDYAFWMIKSPNSNNSSPFLDLSILSVEDEQSYALSLRT